MPQETTGQGTLVRLLAATPGLNNSLPPFRLVHDPEKGIIELSKAVNVDVLRDYSVARRLGYVQVEAIANSHSMWADGGDCLFVGDGYLCRWLNSETAVRLGALTAVTLKMYFVKVGELIFYSNRLDAGVVHGNTLEAWDAPEYTGPESIRKFSTPLRGTCLTEYHGRIYMAVENAVWYTEYMNYYQMDLANNFMVMAGSVGDILATEDGLWISTSNGLEFFQGTSLREFTRTSIDCAPMFPGSAAKIPVGLLSVAGTWYYTANRDGIFMLGPGGQVKHVTESRIEIGEGTSATAACFGGKYVVTIE